MKANIKIEEKMIYIIFALLVVFINNATAQDENIPNYENFIGTWEYKTDKEHFILKTKTHYYTYKNKKYYLVFGVYKYVKNGVVIHDCLNKLKECTIEDDYVIFFGPFGKLSDNIPLTQLYISYTERSVEDLYRSKGYRSPLTYIPGNPAQLSWHLEPDEYIELIFEDEETEAVEETNKSEEKTTNPASIPVNEDMVHLDERPRSDLFTIPVDMILTKIE